jgi:hypothetical protein
MMTDQEWDHFVELYRELWKAYADIATYKTMLKGAEFAMRDDRPDMARQTLSGWEERMIEIRKASFYKQYLERGEAEIALAQEQRDEASLIEQLSKAPPPEYLN